MDIYRDIILDHYHNPRNFGHLENPDVVVEDGNVSCGDRIVIELKLTPHHQQPTTHNPPPTIINDIRFSGEGCAINQAAASMLTEKVLGMSVEEVKKLGTSDILAMLGTTLTPARIRCATLPLEVLHKAIHQLVKS